MKGFYDILVAFLRSVAIDSLEKNKLKEPFRNFIVDAQDLKERIETIEEEGDYLITYLICETLPLKINII